MPKILKSNKQCSKCQSKNVYVTKKYLVCRKCGYKGKR